MDNYTALGQGLKLYTDAMRRLVQDRLIVAFPSSWWNDSVIGALHDPQRANVKRDADRNPDKPKIDFVDPAHLPPIIARNFDRAFKTVFPDFRKTQAWLQTVANARNDWAHARSGDMSSDEVANALYTMGQVLSAAKLPEATQVEQLRKDILGIKPEPTASATLPLHRVERQEPIRGMGSGGEVSPTAHTPYWWEVCEPHDAFQNPATIDESLFAATLGGVHAGAARKEYLDPAVFFSHTYFTENLKQTIRDIASRMAGGDGPSVTEMQTPFGGGKTHALLALYHLIRHPEASLAVPGVKEALGSMRFPPGARVLVFDGYEYGTEPVQKEDGATVNTLWGELAHQADRPLFHKLVSGSDANAEAPGNALFRQVLEQASPCLILIDELVSYLVKLKFATSRRTTNLYRQTVQFVQELLQLAGNSPGVCVLLSLPKSKREFGGLDPAQVQMELGVVEELQARADRVVSKRTPVNDEEVYTLIAKRLFKRVDPAAATQVAALYQDTYKRTRGLYDPTVLTPDYVQQQVRAYPLHPELIDVLYKKWSTASDFPRTRAVLQLLANVVADQWVARRHAYAIQSAHVSLERERIRTRIVSAAGAGGGYDAVVAADIIGGDAHADEIDQRRGDDYLRHHIARGVATTLLMHSFGGTTRTGALSAELRLGTVAPNVGPEYVSEVLDALEQSLWYVHREGDLLRFLTRPNVYRVIAQTAETQPAAAVAQRLRETLDAAAGNADGFRVLTWAASDGAVADRPDPTIAILDAKYAVSQENSSGMSGRAPADQLWEKHGGGLRDYRNALLLVAPDADLLGRAEDAVREVMAYDTVLANAQKGLLEVSQSELKNLQSRAAAKRESLRTAVTTAYRWIFAPAEKGLDVLSLQVPATKDERIAARVVERLSDTNYGPPKILRKIGALYFSGKVAPHIWKDEKALDLAELTRRLPRWTFLPIIPDRDQALRTCIREGLSLRSWAVAIGDGTTDKYQKLIERPEELDDIVSLFDGSACLVRGELLDLIRMELAPSTATQTAEDEPAVPSPGASGPYAPGAGAHAIEETKTNGPLVPAAIPAPKRYARIKLRIDDLKVGKAGNLQQYLFRVLQEQDAAAELDLTIEVSSAAVGITSDVLDDRIVQGLEMLGISVSWEPV